MSQRAEPHAHDLCAKHAKQFTAPVGWEFLQLLDHLPDDDDLLAVANAVNESNDIPAEAAPEAASGTVQPVDRSVAPTRPTPLPETSSGLRLIRPETL